MSKMNFHCTFTGTKIQESYSPIWILGVMRGRANIGNHITEQYAVIQVNPTEGAIRLLVNLCHEHSHAPIISTRGLQSTNLRIVAREARNCECFKPVKMLLINNVAIIVKTDFWQIIICNLPLGGQLKHKIAVHILNYCSLCRNEIRWKLESSITARVTFSLSQNWMVSRTRFLQTVLFLNFLLSIEKYLTNL